MQTSFRPQDKRRRKTALILLAAALALAVSLFLFDGVVTRLLTYSLYPVTYVRDYLVRTTYPFVRNVIHNRALEDENNRLKTLLEEERREAYEKEIAAAMSTTTEPSLLFDEFGGVVGTSTEMTSLQTGSLRTAAEPAAKRTFSLQGTVVSKPPFSPFDTITLFIADSSAGRQIEPGTPLYVRVGVDDRVPIGTVTSHTGSVIVADLITKPGTNRVMEFGTSSVQHMGEGKGGGMIQFIIPKGIDIREQDPVYLPEYRSVPFSFVHSVKSSEADPLVRVTVLLPVSLFDLRTVYIE